MKTGQDLVNLAQSKKGEVYILGSLAPKDQPNYKGPWDCAELVSWAVYQAIQMLYGCVNDNTSNPGTADAGTIYWTRDVDAGVVSRISIEQARATPGAILLREAGDGLEGHIVISKGDGTTIEAMGHAWGVTNGVVDGRRWSTGILIKGIQYTLNNVVPVAAPVVLRLGVSNNADDVKAVEQALFDLGLYHGEIDGIYGPGCYAAVRAYQIQKGLTPDGEVGKSTAGDLGITLK